MRVSGPAAFPIADILFAGPPYFKPPHHGHSMHVGYVIDPKLGEKVDHCVLLCFRSPHSYTGEDVVELSCHGGAVTLRRVLSLALQSGARMAEPGEFTMRAFLNGRLDLSQAEAVCDLIRARTEAAQRIAVAQLDGRLSREICSIRDELMGVLAAIEASIDFSDEIGELDVAAALKRMRAASDRIERLIQSAQYGRVYREGARVVIVGRPNVGKSSLLNALLGADRAIVTPIAGTTRDVIEEGANIEGIPLVAIDTAGLRETSDPVEVIGVKRAEETLRSSSLALFVLDASSGFMEADHYIAKRLSDIKAIWVANKIDRLDAERHSETVSEIASKDPAKTVIAVSATTGEGLDDLQRAIVRQLTGSALTEQTVVNNLRHEEALRQALGSLKQAIKTAESSMPSDFISIDVRGALDALGLVTGDTATEDLIHRIFQDFCIGK